MKYHALKKMISFHRQVVKIRVIFLYDPNEQRMSSTLYMQCSRRYLPAAVDTNA